MQRSMDTANVSRECAPRDKLRLFSPGAWEEGGRFSTRATIRRLRNSLSCHTNAPMEPGQLVLAGQPPLGKSLGDM
jgi:hypothetical protein